MKSAEVRIITVKRERDPYGGDWWEIIGKDIVTEEKTIGNGRTFKEAMVCLMDEAEE